MISILWVSLYQTPRTAAIEELQQESIHMDTKETPTSSAMTWQQQEPRLGIIAPSRAAVWAALNPAACSRVLEQAEAAASSTKTFALSAPTFYNNLRPLCNALPAVCSPRRCLNEARSSARQIPRAAALSAYAEQPCNHFCGDRQK